VSKTTDKYFKENNITFKKWDFFVENFLIQTIPKDLLFSMKETK
jgi:hypothetical protein